MFMVTSNESSNTFRSDGSCLIYMYVSLVLHFEIEFKRKYAHSMALKVDVSLSVKVTLNVKL